MNSNSVSFPAFQRQSQTQSVTSATQPTISLSTANLNQLSNQTSTNSKPVISKKVNARLQLAAALIECDNDRILSMAIPSTPSRHSPNSPRPPPPPQPKLASESAIFSPYRDEQPTTPATIYRRPRGNSNASRLSNLESATADGDGRRPSIDFLGVKLPKEKKYAYSTHSRGGSSAGVGGFDGIAAGGHSRSASLLSSTGLPQSNISLADGNDQDDDDDEALSDWGVEKFLSSEQRDKIASGRRSRANSIAGVVSTHRPTPTSPGGSRKPWENGNDRPSSAMSFHSTNDPTPMDPGAGVGAGRARSEIVESATSGGNGTSSRGGGADLSLLARIKLYRERQENLPPDQWNGPGPNATSGEVVEHIVRNSPRNARINLPTSEDFDQLKTPIASTLTSSTDTSASNSIAPTPILPSNFSSADVSADLSHTKSASGFQPFTDTQANHSEEIKKLHTRDISTGQVAPQGGADLERRMSALGVTGDRWSDQEDDDDDDEEEFGDFSSANGMGSSKGNNRTSNRSSRAPSPRLNPRHSRGGSLPLDFAAPSASSSQNEAVRSVSPTLARSAGASPILGGQQPLGFGSPRPSATPLQEFEPPPEGMVGIGSYQRSQSRRNSLMALTAEAMESPATPQGALMNPWGEEDGNQPSEEGPGSRPGSRPLSPVNSRAGLQTSRPVTPSGLGGRQTPILGVGAVLPQDPFNAHNIGPSPFPSPMLRLSELAAEEINGVEQPLPAPGFHGLQGGQRLSMPMDGLTTKQLQALARGSTFPEHFGIGGGMDESPMQTDDEAELKIINDPFELARLEKKRKKKEKAKEKERLSKLPPLVNLGHDSPTTPVAGETIITEDGEFVSKKKKEKSSKKNKRNSMLPGLALANGLNTEPDLSSSRWSKGKKKFDRENIPPQIEVNQPSTDYSAPESTPRQVLAPVQPIQDLDDVDDSATSPPTKGPLKPRGIEAFLPDTLIMPQPLQGSPQAPTLRLTKSMNDEQRQQQIPPSVKARSSIYVPEGFVLHDGKGLPPVKQLQVHGASGPRPYFNPPIKVDGKQKHDAAVSEFLQSNYALRYLAVPASAPRGIGRRAAVPTTALFRNQLVKHEEEREGWGWELGSAIGDQISIVETEDSEEPLAAKITRAQKKKEKKLAREKRKRKAARRERRAKREQAIREGKGYAAVGVQEDSPDEDLDLSSTSSEEEEESEIDSEEEWNSEDEKRWIDYSKPAGKLFGKSLLDVAAERQAERKSKSRAYGQVEIEEEERADEAYAVKAASLGLPLDAASLAPSSAARSFRDKPLGFNDTRERMEATFGTDLNWAREMAKRREEEAREAEEAEIRKIAEEEFMKGEEDRAARKKAKGIFKGKKQKEKVKAPITRSQISAPIPQGPLNGFADEENHQVEMLEDQYEEDHPPRSRTPVNPPTINLEFGEEGTPEQVKHSKRKGASEAAAEWFARSSDEDSSDDSSSEDEAERRRLALQKARLSRSLGGTGEAKLLAARLAEEDSSSSSEDGAPLAQIKKGLATKSSSFASGLNFGGRPADESSDEELPLAALKAKRKATNSMMGTLDLDFGGASASPKVLSTSHSLASLSKSSPALPAARGEDSDSDEDQPLGLVHANGESALAAFRAANPSKVEESSSDEDDRPLGTQHADTARRVINEQAALIQRLQAEAEARNSQMNGGGPWGMPAMMGPPGFDPRMSMMGMPGMPLPPYQGVGGFDPMMSSMNLAAMSTPQIHQMPSQDAFSTPLAQHPGLPPINISAPSPIPMNHPMNMVQDPKVSSIDRWRSEVPADGNSSAENSKPTSEVRI